MRKAVSVLHAFVVILDQLTRPSVNPFAFATLFPLRRGAKLDRGPEPEGGRGRDTHFFGKFTPAPGSCEGAAGFFTKGFSYAHTGTGRGAKGPGQHGVRMVLLRDILHREGRGPGGAYRCVALQNRSGGQVEGW